MNCHYLPKRPGPAPLWHLAICADCRKQRRTDDLIGFALSCRKAEPVAAGVLAATLASLDLPYSLPRRRFPVAAFVRRFRRPLMVLAALASVLMVAYLRYIEIDPKVVIPAPAFEGPDAADDFAHAYALLQQKDLLGRMVRPGKLSFGEGSFGDPRYGESGRGGPGDGGAKERPRYSVAEREAVVRKNGAALASIEQGLSHKYWLDTTDGGSLYELQSQFSELDRLLRLDAETAEDRGEWARAAQCGLDIVELGVQLQSTTGTAGFQYGFPHEAIGRRVVWQTLDHLSSAEARAAALRLEKISARRPSAATALEDEKRMILASVQKRMREPNWRFRAEYSSSFAASVRAYLESLPYSRARIVDMVSRDLDRQIEMSRRPYAPNSRSAPTGPEYPEPLRPFLPVYSGSGYLNELDDAKDRLLIAALALRAYKLDHGVYPESLDRLKGETLEAVPLDPFNGGRPLKYRRTGRSYLLYSVGSDGADGGGKPPVRQAAGSGDIVAGTGSE